MIKCNLVCKEYLIHPCYLGHPTSSNWRIWVEQLSPEEVRELEEQSENDLDLARKLFCAIFKNSVRDQMKFTAQDRKRRDSILTT